MLAPAPSVLRLDRWILIFLLLALLQCSGGAVMSNLCWNTWWSLSFPLVCGRSNLSSNNVCRIQRGCCCALVQAPFPLAVGIEKCIGIARCLLLCFTLLGAMLKRSSKMSRREMSLRELETIGNTMCRCTVGRLLISHDSETHIHARSLRLCTR